MEGLGYMGRYDDGTSPYDPTCAGMRITGRQGVIAKINHSPVLDEGLHYEMQAEEARRSVGWNFPNGGAGFL
jgi:hypothetical protein